MKKIIFFLLVIQSLNAQYVHRDMYYVDQNSTFYFDNYDSYDKFSDLVSLVVSKPKQGYALEIIKEPSRLEDELADKALDEVPSKSSNGSVFVVSLAPYHDWIKIEYIVFVYVENREKYWIMIKAKRK